jgi:thiosulfate/3-mercaptopyruvate sulfurtransferase
MCVIEAVYGGSIRTVDRIRAIGNPSEHKHGRRTDMPNDPFIDPAALSSLGPVRYLDARDQAAFDAGHAPNAVRAPVDTWDKAIKTADIGFGQTAFWEEALGSIGVGPGVTAVTYDAGGMTNAARVWFVLQFFGVPCLIVNGGWPALAASGIPVGAGSASQGFPLSPGAGAAGVLDWETLKRQLNGAAHLFDSRTRAEFTGEDSRGRARSGHLPGARHLSHADLMDKGVVHLAPILRGMMEGVGFGPGDHIVTHCEGGGRAALAAAAALRAGFDNVRVYYLSFGDWARDESCPIVRD